MENQQLTETQNLSWKIDKLEAELKLLKAWKDKQEIDERLQMEEAAEAKKALETFVGRRTKEALQQQEELERLKAMFV